MPRSDPEKRGCLAVERLRFGLQFRRLRAFLGRGSQTGREEDYETHPRTAALVVEVSVTTLAEDREMISLYAEAGVSEFWIVNARDRWP